MACGGCGRFYRCLSRVCRFQRRWVRNSEGVCMGRMRKPEKCRLEISQGDYLIVKKHLTAGEERRVFARMVMGGAMVVGEKARVDPMEVGRATALAYLLEWSLTRDDRTPIPLDPSNPDAVAAILDDLDPESYKEIVEAIQAHDTAMTELREKEKNDRGGANTTSPSSQSAA